MQNVLYLFCLNLTTLTSERKRKMTTYNIQKHEGFKHLNPKLSDYKKNLFNPINIKKIGNERIINWKQKDG